MTDQQEAVADARPRGRWRQAALVAVLCTAQALEVLGVTVVIVALPEIGADLGLPDSRLQLVVSLYAVLYGSLLLTAGRVADVVDKRLVFAVGMALTLAGAVCCALAGPRAAAGPGGPGSRVSGRDPGRAVDTHLQLPDGPRPALGGELLDGGRGRRRRGRLRARRAGGADGGLDQS